MTGKKFFKAIFSSSLPTRPSSVKSGWQSQLKRPQNSVCFTSARLILFCVEFVYRKKYVQSTPGDWTGTWNQHPVLPVWLLATLLSVRVCNLQMAIISKSSRKQFSLKKHKLATRTCRFMKMMMRLFLYPDAGALKRMIPDDWQRRFILRLQGGFFISMTHTIPFAGRCDEPASHW